MVVVTSTAGVVGYKGRALLYFLDVLVRSNVKKIQEANDGLGI